MRLVVDSNRIIAGLIRDSCVRQILLSPEFEFFVPHREIQPDLCEMFKYGGLSQ